MEIHKYPDSIARFYDLIYHQIRDGVDNDFFIGEVKKTRGKVLEIGVGTGRFFMEEIRSGADIYGIDISDSMISVLKNKLDPDQHYRISNQNILDFSFDFKFDLIIAPFRVFMHVLEKENQIVALNNVFKHLNPGGRFIFDVFIPDLRLLLKGFDHQVDFEGEYEPGKKVRRIVSSNPDIINQIINVHFELGWDDEQSVRKEVWDLPMRFFFRFELEHLVERSSFTKYKMYGDYNKNGLNETSKEFVVECRKE